MPYKHAPENRQMRKKPIGPRDSRPTIGLLAYNMDRKQPLWLGVADAARERDANLICFVGGPIGGLMPSSGATGGADIIYDLVSVENLDGLVTWAGPGVAVSQHFDQEGVMAFLGRYTSLPIVNYERAIQGIPSVFTDTRQGMRAVLAHLIEVHGCRCIALIRGPEDHFETQERVQAYTETMAEHGLPIDPNLISPGGVFGVEHGAWAMTWLLDERGLRPHKDIDAVAATESEFAQGALAVLRERGIQVPDDVAVVGFNDYLEDRAVTPPLTTVRKPFYEAGQKAVELLFDLLEGRQVPETVSVPTELIVRQSCGCLSPTVVQAAAGTVTEPGGPFEVVLAQSQDIVAEMEQALRPDSTGIAPDRAKRLFKAFVAEVGSGSTDAFLSALDGLLREVMAVGDDVTAWHGALSVLRRRTLPYLIGDQEALLRAYDLWEQARMLIGDTAQRAQLHQMLQAERQATALRQISEALATSTDMEALTDVLAERLPQLGISSCYVSLYEPGLWHGAQNPRQDEPLWAVPEWSRLILAYDEADPSGPRRVKLEPGGRRFPSRQLVPPDLLPQSRRYTLIAQALYFRENSLGFVLFEMGPREEEVYHALRGQISSALQAVLLTQQARRRALQFQTAAEVSRAASGILDPNELIQRVVELARERFDLYYAGLFLVDQTGEWTDEPGKWAVLRAGTGEAGQKMLEQGHKLEIGGASMIGWCVANKQARIALDVGAEAVRFDNPLLPETRSELALPLVSRGEVIGALTIQSAQEAAFSPEDITVLQTMADQLANAIANARLFEQAQARAVELGVLDEMSRALTLMLNTDTVLENVYHHTSRLIDTANFYIAFYDAQKDEVSFPLYQVEGQRIGQVESRRGGKGLTEHVIRTRQPLLIKENIATHLRELGIEMIGREAQSWLGAPMLIGDQVLGVIAVQSYTTPRVYNEHHRDLLSAIANQTAIAIQNARLLEQAQTRAAELAVLNEVGQALTARLSMDEVLNEVYRGVSRLMDTTNFYLALYDPSKDEITFPLDVTQEEKDKFHALAADEGLTGYIIRNRTSVLIRENLPERLAEMGVKMVGQPAASWLGVPMMIGDRVLGVIGVQNYTMPAAYDEHDHDLLTVLASQAAIAIQNARLFDEQQQISLLLSGRVRELDCLNDIGRKIDESPPIPDLLEWVAERIPPAMQHPEACVVAVEFEGQIHGRPEALNLPRQMVGSLRAGDERLGQVYIAYTEDYDFLDEESALLGDIVRRLSGYIESRRLLAQTQAALQEVEATHRRYLRQAWSEYLQATGPLGYEARRPDVPPLGDTVLPEIHQAIEQQRPTVVATSQGNGSAALVAPITLRGTVIGALGVHAEDGARQWSEDEIALVEAIAERVAQVAENLRLLDEAQRRAGRERLTSEVTARMSETLDIETVLKVATQAIRRALDVPEVVIRLAPGQDTGSGQS